MRYAIVATKPGGIEVFNRVVLGDLVVGASEVLIRHEAICAKLILVPHNPHFAPSAKRTS